MRLGRISFHNVKGYLKDGMESLKDHNYLISKTQRISAAAIDELEGNITIIDIRNKNEWEGGHFENSTNIPLNHLMDRRSERPISCSVMVHCKCW